MLKNLILLLEHRYFSAGFLPSCPLKILTEFYRTLLEKLMKIAKLLKKSTTVYAAEKVIAIFRIFSSVDPM